VATEASLNDLAGLIREKNEHDARITAIVGRPALIGHVGEYIASRVFGIRLHESAVHKGSDGVFSDGALAGRSVNVKWYARNEGLLDLHQTDPPDFYLVLSGPAPSGAFVKGGVRPWLITQVHVFDASMLHATLAQSGTKIGVASSVRKAYWIDAEVYPTPRNQLLVLSAEQRGMLALFS
jgi:hypothetical protein